MQCVAEIWRSIGDWILTTALSALRGLEQELKALSYHCITSSFTLAVPECSMPSACAAE
jgi:hypothetical protein